MPEKPRRHRERFVLAVGALSSQALASLIGVGDRCPLGCTTRQQSLPGRKCDVVMFLDPHAIGLGYECGISSALTQSSEKGVLAAAVAATAAEVAATAAVRDTSADTSALQPSHGRRTHYSPKLQ